MDISSFPVLQEIIDKMDPIEKLWNTAYEFERCHELWFYGPFIGLNVEEIRELVDSMFRVKY